MHKCIVVKIKGSKKRKLMKKASLNENRGEFINFVEIVGIYKLFRNKGEYAICIIDLGVRDDPCCGV